MESADPHWSRGTGPAPRFPPLKSQRSGTPLSPLRRALTMQGSSGRGAREVATVVTVVRGSLSFLSLPARRGGLLLFLCSPQFQAQKSQKASALAFPKSPTHRAGARESFGSPPEEGRGGGQRKKGGAPPARKSLSARRVQTPPPHSFSLLPAFFRDRAAKKKKKTSPRGAVGDPPRARARSLSSPPPHSLPQAKMRARPLALAQSAGGGRLWNAGGRETCNLRNKIIRAKERRAPACFYFFPPTARTRPVDAPHPKNSSEPGGGGGREDKKKKKERQAARFARARSRLAKLLWTALRGGACPSLRRERERTAGEARLQAGPGKGSWCRSPWPP